MPGSSFGEIDLVRHSGYHSRALSSVSIVAVVNPGFLPLCPHQGSGDDG
jgi:hypothetical protein